MTTHNVSTDGEFATAVTSIQGEGGAGHEIILQDSVNFGRVLDGVQFTDYVTVKSQTSLGAFIDGFMDDVAYVDIQDVRMLRINSDRATNVKVSNCQLDALNSTHVVIFNQGNFIEITNSTLDNARDDIMRLINCQDVLIDRNFMRDCSPIDPDSHPDVIQVGDWIGGAQRVERLTITNNLCYDDISTGAEKAQGIFVKIGGGEDIIIENNMVLSGLSNGINLENTDAGDPFTGCRVKNNTVLGRNLVMEGVQHGTQTEDNVAATVIFPGYSDPTSTSTNTGNFAHNDTGLDLLFVNDGGIEPGKAGKNWEDYIPVEGSSIEFIGAITRINELQGAAPPSSLEITSVTIDDMAMGTVSVVGTQGEADYKVRYTPDAGFFGVARGHYSIDDGQGGTDTTTWSIPVTKTNPEAVDDTFAPIAQGSGAVDLDVLANDIE